jgi:tetratricopeptide (TPR) repeat protein
MKRAQSDSKAGDTSMRAVMRQALEYHRQGQWLRAEGLCQLILDKHPDHVPALQLLGELCFAQGRMDEALALAERARALRPRDGATLYNLGTVLAALGRHAEALASLDAALRERPRDAAALINRANALQALTRNDEALASLDAALAIEPRSAQGHYNRGNVLQALGRLEDAVGAYDGALALQPQNADALINRGNALHGLDRNDAALASYDAALALDPARADAHYDRGATLRALARDREALEAFDRAVALDPGYVDAHWSRALINLMLGNLQAGWIEYEWRWKTSQSIYERRDFDQPLWSAALDARDRTVLLRPEQGIGDTLQFLRYLPMVAERCGRVVLLLQPSLLRLCERYRGLAELVVEGAPVPPHDYQCPMGSLPLAFETSLQTIPANVPYLGADPALAEKWRARLAPASRTIRIGLAWAGNPRQKSEPRRGVGLDRCAPLLEVPGTRWVSLQVGPRAADIARLSGGTIIDLSAELTDFAETAGVIANLDLVITSDTAVAHLAGAMGRPVWILLMHTPDWRWMRGRSDSPWYPTARLFRQERPGDWPSAVARVREALAGLGQGSTAVERQP